MKIKHIIIAVLTLFISIPLFSQEKVESLDTIYMLGRKKLVVDVRNISSSTIRYYDAKEEKIVTLGRKQIQKIIFSNGRKEVFNKPVMMMVAEGDWKTVIVTDRKDDVNGLYDLGDVSSKSSAGSRSAKSAKKSAIIRLQKKAALLGGMIVLVTNEQSIGGFGEQPTYIVEGKAYGYEPPKKEEKKEKEKTKKTKK